MHLEHKWTSEQTFWSQKQLSKFLKYSQQKSFPTLTRTLTTSYAEIEGYSHISVFNERETVQNLECKKAKKCLRQLSNQKHSDPSNESLRELYHEQFNV